MKGKEDVLMHQANSKVIMGYAAKYLACKNRDHDVVEYALSRSLSPTVIAQYQTRLPDKALLQAKLDEFYELAKMESGQ